MPLLKRPSPRKNTKAKEKISSLSNLFSHLYIASKYRDGNLEDFLAHENQPWPPSPSDHGKLRLPSNKSDLLSLLDTEVMLEPPSNFHAKIIDGPATFHVQCSTFDDYCNFIPWMKKELTTCDRIDIIWDVYKACSLKESTREKRGKGIRRKVSSQAKFPSNFQDFLRDPKNKEELFSFLTARTSSHNFPPDKLVNITSGLFLVS